MNTAITWDDIVQAAKRLGVEPCAMKAVHSVESAGEGFLPSGRPKILFEGHVFWRELKKRGLSPEQLAPTHSSIIYPKWTKSHYLGGEKEHDRLTEALAVHEEAALASASWGAFQIMGFNHASCGYRTVHDFVSAQKESAAAQLSAFCGFLENNRLVEPLRKKDWAAFAKGYNGPGYAENKYDRRLAEAYARCVKERGQ